MVGKAQINVNVISDEASIYPEPNTNSSLVISAQKGDIFQAQEIREDWVQIHMFSGAKRYIKGSKVEVVYEIPSDSSDLVILSKLCDGIEKAQSTASRESTSKFAYNDSQQGTYQRLLFDKFVLSTFRKFDIPASHTSKLIECVDDGIF